MKALKLEIYQESACYKKPFAFKVAETYPLPPYSTVKGLLHKLINAEEFVPMSISVQGDFENIFFNLQSMYSYKNKKDNTSVPSYIHNLYNVNLIIHVLAEQNVLDAIMGGIRGSAEYFSLGRREDLAVIKSAKEVEIGEVSICDGGEDPYSIKHPVYIPKAQLPEGVRGVNYRLNWKYDIQKDVRIWERIDVVYVERDNVITEGDVLLDEDRDIVFFNNGDRKYALR